MCWQWVLEERIRKCGAFLARRHGGVSGAFGINLYALLANVELSITSESLIDLESSSLNKAKTNKISAANSIKMKESVHPGPTIENFVTDS